MTTRSKILCLFDVDGTLTKPRKVIADTFREFLLNKVKPLASVGLVSGSDYEKICEQMGGESQAAQFDYLFCENGLMQYRGGHLVSQQSILQHIGEPALQRVINFALGYMSKLELPAKRGNFIEFRSSMINLCPVGRSCSQQERNEFAQHDQAHGVRKAFVKALETEFSGAGLTFAMGGQISVDVFPTGWDKTYCLNHVADCHYDEIHFFGDKTSPGGNDYEIYYDSRTIGHAVVSPDDTQQQLTELFKIF